jgi:hypothetical protein
LAPSSFQPPNGQSIHPSLLPHYFKLSSVEFARCFAPPGLCTSPAIHAHSLQNARCLDLLASAGHVVALAKRLSADRPPEIDFTSVGRNSATTFAGLCSNHDQSIFAPIEQRPFDPKSAEHLFLAAYRATFREVHAACEAGLLLQGAYKKRVELGLDPGDVESEAGLLATVQLIVAHQTFCYKLALDDAFLRSDFTVLQHDVIEIYGAHPTVGACSLFSIDKVPQASGTTWACLDILPLSDSRTVAVFSFVNSDAPGARSALSRVLLGADFHQRYEMSKRLLNSCENFVISPAHFATWSERKHVTIRGYFLRTLQRDELEFDDEDLYLF